MTGIVIEPAVHHNQYICFLASWAAVTDLPDVTGGIRPRALLKEAPVGTERCAERRGQMLCWEEPSWGQKWWWHPTGHSSQTPLEELILHSRGLDPEWAPEGAPALLGFGFRKSRASGWDWDKVTWAPCLPALVTKRSVCRRRSPLCSIRDKEK